MGGEKRGRVFGGAEGIEPLLRRGGERRKIVGGRGFGGEVGSGSGRGTTGGVVDGFERGLGLGLLPK